jgi:D-alanyl-D-alanine dipeptidase
MSESCIERSIISPIDPRVLSIPIQDNQEPMIDLLEQDIILFGASPEVLNNRDYTKMRVTVYNKLVTAQQRLPVKLRFCLYEAYRSLALQQQLFNDRHTLLQHTYPDWDAHTLFQETTQIVAPVINWDGSPNTPPHSTGAAIDIYLLDSQNRVVDMGIQVEDWRLDIDGSISKTDSTKISTQAQQYRAIMNHALQAVGFVNYPAEYWHWSYGDRYWAHAVGNAFALYGSV